MRERRGAALLLAAVVLILCGACGRSCGGARPGAGADSDTVTLVFTYSSEKQAWIENATELFNCSAQQTRDGRNIVVKSVPMGSGQCIEEVLSGTRQAHLVSPAATSYIEEGNARSRASVGAAAFGDSRCIVYSPVVIAMWKPMAEALGWGQRPVGWSEILAIAQDPRGWAAYGHPEWGRFRFGHTHPGFSNTGMAALLSASFAATGKTSGLTIEDARSPAVGDYIAKIENSVIHYGTSTGFFGQMMFENGMDYMSASVLYENMVVEAYDQVTAVDSAAAVVPMVAVYPREGTFLTDHPVALVEREWVTPDHREAARIYVEFLLARPQQEAAMARGFRPSFTDLALAAPLNEEHGVDPREPRVVLPMPEHRVINELLEVWKLHKKPSHVVLAVDNSAALAERGGIRSIRESAAQCIRSLGVRDRFSLLVVGDSPAWLGKEVATETERAQVIGRLETLPPGGGSALYDAVLEAYEYARGVERPDVITAVIVMAGSENTSGENRLPTLLPLILGSSDAARVRIFTVGFGRGANRYALEKIADATDAVFLQDTETGAEKLKELTTFF